MFQVPPVTPASVALLVSLGIGSYAVYRRYFRKPHITAGSDVQYRDGVVYLYVFSRSIAKQVPNLSPYGVKVEMWLRMHSIEYEVLPAGPRSKRPKGQVPFIRYNGQIVTDSETIIRFLAEKLNVDPEEGLDVASAGVAHAFGQMLDENTCWTYFLYRYVWHRDLFSKVFRVSSSAWLSRIITGQIKYFTNKRAIYRGIGRNTEDEILEIGKKDLEAVSQWLGDKKYFMGDKPGKIDATMFGHLCQVVYVLDMHYPQRKVLVEEFPNVLEYVDRLKAEFWPDWDTIVDPGTF